MFVNAIKKVKRSTFPIFRFKQLPGNQINIGVAGTGFFVTTEGHFVTVSHIFNNSDSQTKFVFMGQLPESLTTPHLEIENVHRDDNQDIFIGRIAIDVTEPLLLANAIPPVGRSVCIAGYPLAVITNNDQGGLELGGVRPYFQPSFVLDSANLQVNNGAGTVVTHNGFIVRDVGLFGMSGGPVFDIAGKVLGIQGSVTPPRISSNADRTITVENAVAIQASIPLEILRNLNILPSSR